jgi:hypothetical protein
MTGRLKCQARMEGESRTPSLLFMLNVFPHRWRTDQVNGLFIPVRAVSVGVFTCVVNSAPLIVPLNA